MSSAAARRRYIEYLRLDDIEGAAVNPKGHDEAGIAASIDTFGLAEVPLLDERTGRLVAGHGRIGDLRVRRDAGQPPPEGVDVDDDGAWLVPVERGWSSEDDDHAAAYLVASNRLTERGGWEMEPLAELLSSLPTVELLEVAGYGQQELEDLLRSLAPPSLDDLGDQYGDPDPAQLWPVLRFKVSPTARDRYLRLVEGIEGGDDTLFDQLLTWAEAGKGKGRKR